MFREAKPFKVFAVLHGVPAAAIPTYRHSKKMNRLNQSADYIVSKRAVENIVALARDLGILCDTGTGTVHTGMSFFAQMEGSACAVARQCPASLPGISPFRTPSTH